MTLVAAAAGLLALLLAATALTPDARGHGTHEHLGLPPCTFSILFNQPCPSCGMTTAWAWLVRGNLIEACRANAGGALLAIVAAAGIPWLLAAAAGGRWPQWTPSARLAVWLGMAIAIVTMVQWGWRLWH